MEQQAIPWYIVVGIAFCISGIIQALDHLLKRENKPKKKKKHEPETDEGKHISK